MGTERLGLPARLALTAVLAVTLAACSSLGIVILDDPLTAEEHVDLGLSYELQGKTDLAEREYLKAATRKPDWAVPHFNLGNVRYRDKDLAGAQRYYRTALDLDSGNPDIMNNLALVLYELGEDRQAKALIERALSIRSRDEYRETLRRIDAGMHERAPVP